MQFDKQTTLKQDKNFLEKPTTSINFYQNYFASIKGVRLKVFWHLLDK